jgi:antitoxin FitA
MRLERARLTSERTPRASFRATRRRSSPTRRDQAPAAPAIQQQRCYIAFMSVAITIRDVPAEVRDELAARAARAGKSLQEYVRGMLVDSVARPAVDDVIARARARVDATGIAVDVRATLAARDADRR